MVRGRILHPTGMNHRFSSIYLASILCLLVLALAPAAVLGRQGAAGNGVLAAGDTVRFATRVLGFSSQYSETSWSAAQALGEPDTYPRHGDISTAWASSSSDGSREYLVLGYDDPQPVRAVAIYETYNPGAVDTVYVRNAVTGSWNVVWSGTAAPTTEKARIFYVTFAATSYPVDAVRIALDSRAVPGWNEIDAVGLVTGTPSVPGRDYALRFDGVDDQLLLPLPEALSTYTVEAWVRPMKTVDQSVLLRSAASGPASQFSHQLLIQDGRFAHYLYDGGRRYLAGTTTIIPGQWYHVAITAEAGGVMRLYVNGTEEGTPVTISTPWSGGDRFYVGSASNNSAAFEGDVDEVRVWNTVRPQNEIAARMRERLEGNEPGLAGYWRLDEGEGTAVRDATGRNADGTLQNGTRWTPSTVNDPTEYALSLSSIGACAPASLPLRWNTVPSAARYRIDAATAPEEAAIVAQVDAGTGDTFAFSTASLQEGGTYHVRVVGLGSGGAPVASSAFSTAFVVDRTAPVAGRPEAILREDGEVAFHFPASDNLGATEMHVQVATDAAFTNLILDDQISYEAAEEVEVDATPGAMLYARARAIDCAGNESAWSAVSAPVQAPLRPDLVVVEVSAPPTAFSGQEIEVSWIVENVGEGATNVPAWEEQVYLIDAPTFDPNTAVAVAHAENVSALAPGERYVGRAKFVLPDGVQGDYYVAVVADGRYAQQTESNEANNARVSAKMQVSLAAYPDLQVTSILAPAEAFSGDYIEVKWTVQNKGQGATDQSRWYDTVYLSPDSTLDFTYVGTGGIRVDDPLLYTLAHGGILDPNGTYEASATVALPDTVFGDVYLFVWTDLSRYTNSERGFVYEYVNEMNNTLRKPIKITLTPPPDLTVASANAPASVQSGSPVTIEWTTKNEGPGATRSPYWRETAYLSPTEVFDAKAAHLLGSRWYRGEIAPGATYTQSLDATIPNGLAGTYHLFVAVDDQGHVFEHTYEDNNLVKVATMEVSLAPWADLRVTDIVVPEDAVAGAVVPVRWTVVNEGEAAVEAGAWTDRVYVHDAATWDSTATLLGEETIRETLQPGATYTREAHIRLPATLDGTYSLFVRTDVGDRIYEHTGESNNTLRAQIEIDAYPPIDLAVQRVTAPPTGRSGQPWTVSWEVSNVGGGATLADKWTDAVYLSTDNVLSPDTDVLLHRETRRTPLGAGEKYTRDLSVVLPNGIAGDYYLLVRTDAEGEAQDADPANNLGVVATPIRITLSDPVDFDVADVTAPQTGVAGQPVTVVWTVQKRGAGQPSVSAWYDELYLSRDGKIDANDTRLGAVQQTRGTGAWTEYTDTLEVTLPIFASGTFNILVKTDGRDDVYEHQAEDNNVRAATINVTVPPPADLVVTNIVAPAQAVPGQGVLLHWTVENRSANPARGRIVEAAYVSTDPVWSIDDALIGVQETTIDLPGGQASAGKMEVELSKTYRVDASGTILDVLPGVPPGDYYILVRTDLRNNIRETDEQNNTTASANRTAVSFPMLTVGQPEAITLSTGVDKFYAFEAEAGKDYLVSLDCDFGFSELYVRHGAVPDRSAYDVAGGALHATDQQATIPTASAGKYYLLLGRHDDLPRPMECTGLVQQLDFEIRDVRQPVAGNTGEVSVVLTGAKFAPGATALLRRNGQPTTEANQVVRFNSAHVYARFATQGLATGAWDVVVRNPDGGEAVLQRGLTIEEGDPMQVKAAIVGPQAIRVRRPTTYVLNLTNPTNVNVERAFVWLTVKGGVDVLAVDVKPIDGDSLGWTPDDLFEDEDGNPTILLVASNIPPGRTTSTQITISPREAGPFEFVGATYALTRADFQALSEQFVQEGLKQDWLELPEPMAAEGSGKTEAVLAGCPYGDAGACAAWDHRQRTLDIVRDLTDEDGPIRDAIDVATANPSKPKKVLKAFGGFLKSLLDFYDKWKDSSGYAGDAVESVDPNDITGPDGHGDERWVSNRQTLGYTVRFENDPKQATAPAQIVRITVPLDETLDERTFRLGEFGFGSFRFTVPDNRATYTARLDVRDSLGVVVDVSAGLDVNTREAFWIFRSIDPATGQPPVNPLVGFLPVNDALQRGEGYVRYSVRPKEEATTGQVVVAQARIVFDINAPLDTPPVANTIDADAPQSAVLALGATSPAQFPLRWAGSDVGSGVRDFALYVSVNDGPFELLTAGTRETVRSFVGQEPNRYRFFSIATDYTGNVEKMKTTADVVTSVDTEKGPGDELPTTFAVHANYPNPFNPETTLPFDLPVRSEVQIRIYNILGQRVMVVEKGMLSAGRYAERVNFSHLASGVYFYEVHARTEAGKLQRDVRKMVFLK